MKNVKRFFFCTKTRKKRTSKKKTKGKNLASQGSVRRKNEKPAIYTSTVGKASGNKANPALTLQDVINQLENENK